MQAAEWQKHTNFRSWRAFQMNIIQHRRLEPVNLNRAIAYIITHELGGDFAGAPRVRDYWARVADVAVKWYADMLSMNIMALGRKDSSNDPAAHYRALRFALVSITALSPAP